MNDYSESAGSAERMCCLMGQVNHCQTSRIRVPVALAGMACLFAFWIAAPSVRSQSLPLSVRVESEVQMGLLFGRQHIRLSDPTAALNLRLDPELFLVGGVLDLSQGGAWTARLAGSLSIFERGHGLSETPLSGGSSQSRSGPLWDLSPSFKSWEAAGQYHFLMWRGYRYSLLAGYRQILTRYSGQPKSDSSLSPAATLQANHAFDIPHMGIATTFSGPSWRGRVELIGSPFVSASGSVSHGEPPSRPVRSYRGTFSGLEYSLKIDGAMNLGPDIMAGIYGAYHRLDLEGHASEDASPEFRSSAEADFGIIGLSFLYFF